MPPILRLPVGAQGVPPGDQGAKTDASTSMNEAGGRLKTDTGKTKDDVEAMDVNKAKQDVGQVNTDVQASRKASRKRRPIRSANNSAGRIKSACSDLKGQPSLATQRQEEYNPQKGMNTDRPKRDSMSLEEAS